MSERTIFQPSLNLYFLFHLCGNSSNQFLPPRSEDSITYIPQLVRRQNSWESANNALTFSTIPQNTKKASFWFILQQGGGLDI